MPGDFSDLDAIRVGSDYYAYSSTMQYSPGALILHSKDLVNWTMLGHVVKDLTVLDAAFNWDSMSRAGRGIWAGSLRYHSGKFWVYFGTPDQGIYVSTAFHPAGPWTQPKLVLREKGWDDPCSFWDDDGQEYLVATHFGTDQTTGTEYTIHLFRLNPAGDMIEAGADQVIHRSSGSEANKLYKIRGMYYHYYSENAPEGRVGMMERSKSLNGPWEIHQLMHVDGAVDKEPNQGGLVELPSGKWYFLSHQGRGDWEGRAGVLLPVTLVSGWPIIGRVGSDGIGNMVWRGVKPIRGFPRTLLSASDKFSSPVLKPEWEWNYQPRRDMWSITAHPGFLRLHAFPPLHTNRFETIGNVITQRSIWTRQNQVTVKLSLAGMADEEEAGLAHFAGTYCTLGIIQLEEVRKLAYNNYGKRITGPVVRRNVIFLRSKWDFHGMSQFSYSTDGHTFQSFGAPYQLTWGAYRGDRIGIFTDNPGSLSGYVDVDEFMYQIEPSDASVHPVRLGSRERK
jgi:beta-xylosidase